MSEESLTEVWKDVVGYEGLYQVSDLGRVKSRNKIMTPVKHKHGYLKIQLRKEGVSKNFFIHRLVMIAFKGFSYLVTDHLNRNKEDNRLSNLEYVSSRENSCRGILSDLSVSKKVPVRGVTTNKSGRFLPMKSINGIPTYLGCYGSIEEAENAYLEGERTSSALCVNERKGVYRVKGKDFWQASAYISGKQKNLGWYDRKEDAEEAFALGVKTSKCRKRTVKGVYWHKATKKWIVAFTVNGKFKHFGSFSTKEEATKHYTIFKKEVESCPA